MNEVELLKKRIAREIAARKQAEQVLEYKALELHEANEKLRKLNQSLEDTVAQRTKELAESKQQFQSLVESAGDIIFNTNAGGFFTYVNPVTEKILGIDIELLHGKHFTDLIPEPHRQRVSQFYQNQMMKLEVTSYLEFPVAKADGSLIWLGQRVDMIFEGEKPVKITAIARDIGQLIEARKALQASEEKYRGIIEGMQLGMLEINQQGLITKAYPHFCEMTGYEEHELLGKDPIPLLTHPDDYGIIAQQEKNRDKGQSGVYEMRIKKKDGEYLWVVISGAPFYSTKGEKIGSAGIHLDISGQKRLQRELEVAKEEAEAARQAEKQFLAKMSHELRTPLNALTGITYLLATTNLSPLQQEYLQDIQYASDLLQGMVSDVLDLSKIEAGELVAAMSECHLREAVGMLAKTLEYRARDKENELIYHIDSAVPEVVITDKNIVNQILLNLVGNAIKFTRQGTISIVVSATGQSGNKVSLEFSVIDTGVGISPDKLDTVFERYRQEKDDTHEQYGGTGLGLTICKELVKVLGGQIEVESELDEGSTFTFTIEARLTEGLGQTRASSQQPEAQQGNTDLKKILVAEDSFLNRKYITGLLNQWKVEYQMAVDGQEALEMSRKEPYAIILMDMQMPRMNGYEATHSIRNEADNPNSQTPIIALTASALLEEKRKAENAGVNLHLSKPFAPEHLRRAFINMAPQLISTHTQVVKNKQPFLQMRLPEKVNAQSLIQLYGNDLEHASHVVSLFIESLTESLNSGKDLLDEKDKDGLQKWLHKMKPSFIMVGNETLTEQFGELESALKQSESLQGFEQRIEAIIFEAGEMEQSAKNLLEAINKSL